MKKVVNKSAIKLSCIGFLFLCFFARAQNTTDGQISKIRETVAKINKDSGYTIKAFNQEDFMEYPTDNGGDMKAYYKDGKLLKIVEGTGFSSCENTTEYYFDRGKLIFVYDQESNAPYNDSTTDFNFNKTTLTRECRFYFYNEKLIKSVLKGNSRCGGEARVELATQDLEESVRLRKFLSKH